MFMNEFIKQMKRMGKVIEIDIYTRPNDVTEVNVWHKDNCTLTYYYFDKNGDIIDIL